MKFDVIDFVKFDDCDGSFDIVEVEGKDVVDCMINYFNDSNFNVSSLKKVSKDKWIVYEGDFNYLIKQK
jgi:hypothetical protein